MHRHVYMDARDAHACIQLLPWISVKSNRKKCWTPKISGPVIQALSWWAASDCWDSTLQISTIIKMLASLNPPLCRIMSRLPHVLFSSPLPPVVAYFPSTHLQPRSILQPLSRQKHPKANPRLERGFLESEPSLTYWLARSSLHLAQHDRRSAGKWAHQMGR